jgi:mannose-6-phosphate isomerase-like protein (cupin superfamily)
MTAELDRIPPLHGWHTVRWTPLRRHFGISAFGVNVYAVDKAGETVITSHSEEDGDPARGHEELYIVLSGRARFIVGDTEIDAPAGTCVYVGDPAAERMATAEEENTRVLVVGAKPGEAFKPSAWEFAAAVMHHYEAREYEVALPLAREGMELHPDDARLVYNVACLEALTGDAESALAHLGVAVEIRPDLADVAACDDDLEPLRGDRRFPVSAG